MKIINCVLVSTLVLFLASCTKKDEALSEETFPKADFSFSGSTIATLEIAFTNSSSNAVSYKWDFGDSASSRDQNPKHIYKRPDTYTVTLTTFGKPTLNTPSDVITKTIKIDAPTVAQITSVTLSGMDSLKSGGENWDDDAGPDIFHRFYDDQGVRSIASSIYLNAQPGSFPLVWAVDDIKQIGNYYIHDFNANCRFTFYDYDDLYGDDLLPEYNFKLADYISAEYPSHITLQDLGSPYKVELSLVWH